MIKDNPRKYGEPPYSVVLVHGGPGAPGEMAPVAKEISKKFSVLEPLQTKNTINAQVKELKKLIKDNSKTPVTLIGWSWGAWLSFIFTAENPDMVKKLIMIGCGPFEEEYAQSIMPTRLANLKPKEKKRVEELTKLLQKPKKNDKLLKEFGKLISRADSYYPITHTEEDVEVQADIYASIWKQAELLRKSGKLLKYGQKIKKPVVVMHGDFDPHPFKGVKEPLSKVLKKCKYILIEECGHRPWYEKDARDEFFELLANELGNKNH